MRRFLSIFLTIAAVGIGCGDDSGTGGRGGSGGSGGAGGTGGTGGRGGTGGTGGMGGMGGMGGADAAGDAMENPDASTVECVTYCACMQANCRSVNGTNYVPGGNPDACRMMCEMQSTWDLTCRSMHCDYIAMGMDPTVHCPHAAGQAVCN